MPLGMNVRYFLQRQIVFNDAVMHDHHSPDLVRVSIGYGWFTVSGSAGMPYADSSVQRLFFQEPFKIHQFPGTAPNFYIAIIHGTDSGGIIASIFQHFQPAHDNRCSVLMSHITDNSAHKSTFSIKTVCCVISEPLHIVCQQGIRTFALDIGML